MATNLWNFLYSFSWERGISTYTIDEMHNSLKELDLDKHFDSLEKAFDVQKSLIEKLKADNDVLKKEVRELRNKLPESERPPTILTDVNTNKGCSVPYPELRTIKCLVKWSKLEYNATESRVIERIRSSLADLKVELEVQPWSNVARNPMHPVIVFCQGDVDPNNLSTEFRPPHGPLLVILMYEQQDNTPSAAFQPVESRINAQQRRNAKILLAVDLMYRHRRLIDNEINNASLVRVVDYLADYEH